MKIQAGDRIVYTPTLENGGILEWDGISGYIKEIKEDYYGFRVRVKITVDPEFRYRIGGQTGFETYSSRLTKIGISWEV